MTKLLLLVFIGLFITSSAQAQFGGYIAPYADDRGCYCEGDNTSGFMTVYIFHAYPPGAVASQFSVQVHGLPLTYIGETSNYQTIGSAPTGVSIGYGTCMTSSILILEINYLGVSYPCDMIRIEQDPNAIPPGIWVADCDNPPNVVSAIGWDMYLNNDGGCYCTAGPMEDCTIPVEETSWGEIKALYR
jgi:hypothetical protein